MFVEQKLLPPKSIFQIAKLEVACYRRMAQLGNDRRMLVAWIRKYAPEGSIDQAMAYIEGKDSFSPRIIRDPFNAGESFEIIYKDAEQTDKSQ